jgi:DNA-binding transcriptional LysR family regulator
MDKLDAMRLFTRVVERRSFTQAANDTGVPRSTVTQVINQLEARLNVRLLQRTTRTVKPTLDGEAYYRRCLSILDDVEDAEGAFRDAEPKGMLRIEVQGTLARHFLMPALPAFFARYSNVELTMSESDRWVDLVQEGMDCALRYGKLPDSDLIARQVALLERVTCATPDYFERHGFPTDIPSLSGHRMVGIRSITTGGIAPLEFTGGPELQSVSLPATISVTGPESYCAATRLGLGIAQLPRFHVQEYLSDGTLVAILTHQPPPSVAVSLVYPRNRQLSPRVRAFLAWATQEFANGHSTHQ